jgi:hypothetical protein
MYTSDLYNPYEIGIYSIDEEHAVNLIAEIEDEDGVWYATIFVWNIETNEIEFYDTAGDYRSRTALIKAIKKRYG